MPRVLITGPTHGIAEYARAAEQAFWTPIERPLIETCTLDLAWEPPVERIDVLAITSRNALAALEPWIDELREVPCAVVGARTARHCSELGLNVQGPPAEDATSLARRLVRESSVARSVFWPRGSLSNDLATTLRDAGHRVWNPVVYETVAIEDSTPIPDAHALFFASPSAVRAFLELPVERPTELTIAVAIGSTTANELRLGNRVAFYDILTLPHPAPDALAWRLSNLGYEPPEHE